MTATLLPFLLGALSMGCAAIALFFIRYYQLAKDELFVWFALAFTAFGVQWGLLSFGVVSEQTHVLYLLRLLGFILIMVAIVRKNRRAT
jgi:hypothetical protein